MRPLTPRQQEIYDAYRDCNFSEKKTCKYLAKKKAISTTCLRKHLLLCAKKGWSVDADTFCEQAPVGFELTKSTIQVNSEGQVVQRWDRVSPALSDIDDFLEHLDARTPVLASPILGPEKFSENLMLEWKLMDHHMGMYSWAAETGASYGIEMAQFLIEQAARAVFGSHGHVARTVIVLGGDTFHSDNRDGKTEKSGHSLSVEGRYEESLDAAYAAMTTAIDIALQKSDQVDVIILSGNHDWHTAKGFSRTLAAHYRSCDRCHVDISPGQHKFVRWGNNYYMYTHGDTAPANRLATYMLNHIIDNDITGIRRKLVRKAHLHKRGRVVPPGLIEENGVIIETYPTMAAPEAYSVEAAYCQCRATVAEVYHKEYGMRSRMELGVNELMESWPEAA